MIHKTIHCEKDGTLRALLTKDEIINTQSIVLTGNVSNDDFNVLSTMAKDFALCVIDMSNAFAVKTPAIRINFEDSKLQKIRLPHYLQIINNCAFRNTHLTHINIPSSVYEIGIEAFKNSLLEEVFIPASVIKIEKRAFSFTPLRKIEIASKNINFENEAFVNCSSLSEIYLHQKYPPIINIFENLSSISTFDTTLPKKCTIYVPKGSKEFYEKKNVWIKFEKILEKEYDPQSEMIEKDYWREILREKKRRTWGNCLGLLILGGLIVYLIANLSTN